MARATRAWGLTDRVYVGTDANTTLTEVYRFILIPSGVLSANRTYTLNWGHCSPPHTNFSVVVTSMNPTHNLTIVFPDSTSYTIQPDQQNWVEFVCTSADAWLLMRGGFV